MGLAQRAQGLRPGPAHHYKEPYCTNNEGPISENHMVELLLTNGFSSVAVYLTVKNGSMCEEAIRSALDLDDPETSMVILHTNHH